MKKSVFVTLFILALICLGGCKTFLTKSPLETPKWKMESGKVAIEQVERTFDFYVPKTVTAAPSLLFILHGSNGTSQSMRYVTNYEFEKQANQRKNLIVVYERLLQIGYSWSTIHAYVGEALKFYAWYKYGDLEKVTPEILRKYLNELVGKGISESAHNTIVSSLKFLYGKIFELPHLMPEKIERPKKSFRLPRILSKEEVLRMLEATENLKHRVILYGLYSSGLRLGELLKLKLQDIKWDRNQIFIAAAKGKKDRIVPLASLLKDSLQDYCQREKPAVYLFEGIQPCKPYSPTSVQAVVRQAAKKANITQKVTPHVLRHCFATHLHDGGVSIKLIQELLGHKDVKTTMIYTHVSTQTIAAIKSPLDALGKKRNSDIDL